MALMTIHMIGKNPKAAPSSPLFTASPTGMEYAATATISATASPMIDASHARIRKTPSSTNSVTRGSAATIEDSPSELPSGS